MRLVLARVAPCQIGDQTADSWHVLTMVLFGCVGLALLQAVPV